MLKNVCPNYGGGFVPRPIRPKNNWKNDNHLGKYPPTNQHKHRRVDLQAHEQFAENIFPISPELR